MVRVNVSTNALAVAQPMTQDLAGVRLEAVDAVLVLADLRHQ
jgi:hypothetical protein